MDEAVEINGAARRHGIEDDDIHHALRLPLRRVAQNDRRMLVIGPDRGARLLEIVVLDPHDQPVVIHAMPLRRKFYRYL